jgi:molybdenum cofactor cytidylyltransferase
MVDPNDRSICGLILGAGKSSRMGQPKLNLPWHNTTVLGAVLSNLYKGGINRAFVVVNPKRRPVVPEHIPNMDITWVENPDAEVEDMLVSIQTGIIALPDEIKYVFICLGDQPTIQPSVLKHLKEVVSFSTDTLIFPSYNMRRGHPWVVGRALWKDILNLPKNDTVRTFIKAHEKDIKYVNFDCDPPDDMDTPEEYRRLSQNSG